MDAKKKGTLIIVCLQFPGDKSYSMMAIGSIIGQAAPQILKHLIVFDGLVHFEIRPFCAVPLRRVPPDSQMC